MNVQCLRCGTMFSFPTHEVEREYCPNCGFDAPKLDVKADLYEIGIWWKEVKGNAC